jgi:hypothetical protein
MKRMMWRGGPELAVDAGGGQLAQQVLVEIALGVALGQRQDADLLDRRDQEARALDQELGVLHVLGERGAAVQLAEVREHLVAHHPQHLLAGQLLQARPPQVLLVGREHRPPRLLGAGRQLLVAGLVHVEQAGEHEERDLLDHGQRVGDAAGPELGPQLVDVTSDLREARHVQLSGSGGR